ncbi:MAG TPA: hypothetical protein VHC49_01045 [Mycobacteriales bacterium]|nr:hypothetical protein [Mycobacteriales bacterium]
MAFDVNPEDLKSAAKKIGAAHDALIYIEDLGENASGYATQIHYQPAAGKADAVAQKSASNLTLSRDALYGLVEGLLKAAGAYKDIDKYVHQGFTNSFGKTN